MSLKTPDEIKKGLECCLTGNCTDCPYRKLYGVFRCKTERTRDAIGYIRKLEIAMSASPIVHTVDLNDDAVKYIQQLEADNAQLNRCIENITDKLNAANDEIAQLQAERDAAVADIEESQPCFACKNFKRNSGNCGGGKRCLRLAEIAMRNGGTYKGKFFEWRGVQKEE